MKDRVILFTDGACSGNPGPGGWAARLIHPASGRTKDLSGGERLTTNNRMEMTAALKGLEAMSRPVEVDLHSDSKYLIDAFTKGWLTKWRSNGWKTASKKPVENQDLWESLLVAVRRHQKVNWIYVPGHKGHEHNEACDQMAREQAAMFKETAV